MMRPEWIKPALIGAIIGATTTIVVGFTQSGWVLGSSAERMAKQRADAAVMTAMVPICIAQSKTDPNSLVKVAQLDAITSPYERRDFVMKAGWATVPAAKQPDGLLAVACAEVLLTASQRQ
jgi:hypothetical protein